MIHRAPLAAYAIMQHVKVLFLEYPLIKPGAIGDLLQLTPASVLHGKYQLGKAGSR